MNVDGCVNISCVYVYYMYVVFESDDVLLVICNRCVWEIIWCLFLE